VKRATGVEKAPESARSAKIGLLDRYFPILKIEIGKTKKHLKIAAPYWTHISILRFCGNCNIFWLQMFCPIFLKIPLNLKNKKIIKFWEWEKFRKL